MRKAKVIKTLRNGALRLELKQYANGAVGYDVQTGLTRQKVRLGSREEAERRALVALGAAEAGTLEKTAISDAEYVEFLQWKARQGQQRFVPELVEAFREAKADKGRSHKHLRGLFATLDDFAEAFPVAVGSLGRADVERWLDGRGVGPRRWNNLRADLVSLMRFARREGAVGEKLTPVELIERKTHLHTIQTYSPEQLQAILNAVRAPRRNSRADWLPVVVLGAFAGIRPEELAPEPKSQKPGLRWENLLWGRHKIDIPAAVSKVRRRRHVPLLPAAEAFLAPYRRQHGPIAPANSRLIDQTATWAKTSGVKWIPDGLRHSFATHRVALTRDMPALALELGNSVSVCFSHYVDVVHEDVAERYFAIRPN